MKYLAERKLLFSKKNNDERHQVILKIGMPYILQSGDVKFPIDGVAAGCNVEIEGIDEREISYYGMDSVQAINLASNIDPLIERLSEKYDFFWLTGEPYLEG